MFNTFRKGLKEKPDESIWPKDKSFYGVSDPQKKDLARREGAMQSEIRTSFPKEGGSFTQVGGETELFPGIPVEETVRDIARYKHMIPAAIDAYYDLFSVHKLKPEKYCRMVREVYRLFNLMIERECNDKHKIRWEKIRDMVCIVLEFDNAYRFRAQDIIKEARISELELDKGDQYWSKKTGNYKWGFLTEEELKNCKPI